jgi:hypothetical protein
MKPPFQLRAVGAFSPSVSFRRNLSSSRSRHPVTVMASTSVADAAIVDTTRGGGVDFAAGVGLAVRVVAGAPVVARGRAVFRAAFARCDCTSKATVACGEGSRPAIMTNAAIVTNMIATTRVSARGVSSGSTGFTVFGDSSDFADVLDIDVLLGPVGRP